VDALGWATFLSELTGIFVFDILQIPCGPPFLFAFIGFNPRFTTEVYRGIFTEVVQLIPFTNLLL
jgi:hypothetical protein